MQPASQGGGFPDWGDYIVVTADQLPFTAPCDGYYVGMMYDNQATNYAVVIPKGELFPEMSSAPFNNGLADNPLKFGHLVAISYVGAGHGSYVFTPLHKGDTIFIHQGRYALQFGGVFYKAKK